MPAGESPTTAPSPPPSARSEGYIPHTFFGTTIHVNRDYSMQLLAYLNMRTVRLDFPLRILAAENGQHHFSGNYVTDSEELGIELNLIKWHL